MLQLSGEEHFSQTPTEIWPRLTDSEFLAKCLPDLASAESDGSGRLVCRVRPGLSFIKGTLKVTLDIFDQQPPDSVRMRIHSKGIGASALVEMAFKMSEIEAGTQLSWSAEVKDLSGLLKPISHSLIAAAARKVIEDGWAAFRNQLDRVV